MTLALKAPGGFAPANDNARQPRSVLAWPTGKRLATAERHSDLVMLLDYRRLLATAFSEPANDNWRNAAPTAGRADPRSLEEQIDQPETVMTGETVLPTIEQMRELSCVPWGGEPGYEEGPVRQLSTYIDAGGVRLHNLGGLEFINGANLHKYGDPAEYAREKLKSPSDRGRARRPKKRASPSIVPSSGTWSLEDQIDARQEVRVIWHRLPASSVRILEHTLGSIRAQELGEAFRKKGKNAERFGVRLIDRAIDDLRKAWRP